MSERAIQVGDLVQVVRPFPCCPHYPSDFMGVIFVVRGFAHTCKPACCNVRRNSLSAMMDDHWRVEVSRLKRIPPLSELEGQRTEEQIKEPA